MKLAICISGGLLAAGLAVNSGAALAAGGWGYPAPGFGYGPVPAPYGMPHPMYGVPHGQALPALPRPAPGYGMPSSPAAAQGAAKAVVAEPAKAAAQPAAQPEEQPSGSEDAAPPARVTIAQMRFDPARIVVKKGATVTWRQTDRMPHTVTAGDGSFSSPRLTGQGEFSHTFDQAGTFAYYCGLHPSMRGEVQVVD